MKKVYIIFERGDIVAVTDTKEKAQKMIKEIHESQMIKRAYFMEMNVS